MKIEIRKNCKVCGGLITRHKARTYCSVICRSKFHNKKNAWRGVEWQRAKRDREAIKSPNKLQCLVCKKWYVQVCSHTYQVHGLTGREYRQDYDLEVKRGVVPEWFRKVKGDIALENGTVRNLKAGKKYWFVVGDKKAGRYRRSPITLNRLKEARKMRK